MPRATSRARRASYTLRLTKAPTANVNISLIGDGQTMISSSAITPGGQISYEPMWRRPDSGLVTFNPGAITINGAREGTITRADSSSWLDSGFLEGQLFQINGGG